MTTSNIIAFPRRRATGSEPNSTRPKEANPSAASAPAAQAIALAMATRTGRASSEAQQEFAETVIGTAIRFARRKGRSLTSLPPQMRKWLLELCEQGDPTARVVRDWLEGNGHLRSIRPATPNREGM
nr:hypothetical protein RNT25_04466 [arsenite-oxidising bacterium NT-25]